MVISNFLKGAVIGVANIIPGVSGGTMALVMGIYERFITALHNINGGTLGAFLGVFQFKKESWHRFKEEMKRIDGLFLALIALGALTAIGSLARIMTMLLTEWHDPTYGFFFGLVVVSAWAPFVLIKKRNSPAVWIAALLAAFLVVLSAEAVSSSDALIEKARVKQEMQVKTGTGVPAGGDAAGLLYFIFLGAVTISTMILPGVSGSFLLLLLGGYFDVLRAVATFQWLPLAAFALGCVAGVLLFSRFLNFVMTRWHDATMGFLLGLVAGSLWMIWPFKHTATVGDEVIYLGNRLPSGLTCNEILTAATVIAGMIIVGILFYIEKKYSHVDQDSSSRA